MHPVLFTIPSPFYYLLGLGPELFPVHLYGILIASGFLVAMNLSRKQAEREQEDPEQVADLAFLSLVAGLIGARIVFIFTKFDEYVENPAEIVMFWKGGLVFYGGFIGAAVFIAYYSRKHRIDFFKTADILIPYLAMAHAFGRLGCLAAGCCFGQPTDLPWGIVFPITSMTHAQQARDGLVAAHEHPLPVHPTQLYEAGAELVLFAVLLLMRTRKRFHGQLFLIWLACYSVIRSVIETMRGDTERGLYYGLSTSQWISLGVAIAAVVLFVTLRRRRVSLAQATQATAAA
ncbi:MAG: prolipoprotein diacylglyceryl transferase [Myxococcota bacterium]